MAKKIAIARMRSVSSFIKKRNTEPDVMLGLTLREEFRGKRLKGTAIELSNGQNKGATLIAAKQFLKITYPTHDPLKGIGTISPNQGRPVVVIGERGLSDAASRAVSIHNS